jgi:hypothetical protein
MSVTAMHFTSYEVYIWIIHFFRFHVVHAYRWNTKLPMVATCVRALPCPALPCPALPFPALPCPALPCPALPCPSDPCVC